MCEQGRLLPSCSSAARGCWDAGSASSSAGRAVRGPPIEIVVEDGFDRAIGRGADLDARVRPPPRAAPAPKEPDEPDDAETGAEALLGMRALFQDQLAQRRRRRADRGGRRRGCARSSSRRSGDGWTACARQPSCACDCRSTRMMRGDPLALEEDLDGARGQPRLDLGAERSGGARCSNGRRPRRDNRCRPGRSATRRTRKRSTGSGLSAGRSISSNSCRRVTPSRRIGRSSLRSCINSAIAALTSARLWKMRWRSRPRSQRSTISTACSTFALSRGRPRPRRQDRGAVMRRHLGVGAVDLRFVEAGLDDRDLGVVRHEQLRERRRSPRRRGHGRRSSRAASASSSPAA